MVEDKGNRKRRKKTKKKSPWKKILVGLLGILTILVAAGVFVMWRVYSDVRTSTDSMYVEVEGLEPRRENPVVVEEGDDPFSILLMGIDTGEYGRVGQGRSDTLIIMTVNPNTDKTNLVSIPRDTYTEIIGRETMDKINHAYAFGGQAMSINTVQNLFDIPIDYYISINMEGLQQIVDAVGGIDVAPNLTFTQAGYTFTKDQNINMDGYMALEYSRMRYEDPNGDYGRQERQRQVVESTIKKMVTVESVMNYRMVLNSLSANMQTNLSFDHMVDAFTNYNSVINTIDQVQLSGDGRLQDGVYYEFIPEEEIERVSSILKQELEVN